MRYAFCSKSCSTCASLTQATTFTSSVNGTSFDGIYEFEEGEEESLSCRTANCIYLLQCNTCSSQYIGETCQELKNRISCHRGATKNSGDGGNFRMRQHYACSGGYCNSFSISIIQKLKGNGRTNILKPNSKLFEIDIAITKIRKDLEDLWIRKMYSQFPYGCNDRIDSLKDKWKYNCEFAKFISSKCARRRTWSKNNSGLVLDVISCSIAQKLVDLVLLDYQTVYISKVRSLLFHLKRDVLLDVREIYLEIVFKHENLKNSILRNILHFVICDLLMYKISPFNKPCLKIHNKNRDRVIWKIEFVNKALDLLNLPRMLRDKSLKSCVNICNVKEPSVIFTSRPSIASTIFNYNQVVRDFVSIDDIKCFCNEYEDFVNKDCGHVVTGNLDIVKYKTLSDILAKGAGYREPVAVNFKLVRVAISKNINDMISSWSKKEGLPLKCFLGWKLRFEELLEADIKSLEKRYNLTKVKFSSVFKNDSVKKELNSLHDKFVFCPVDKATKNVAIVCKKYYLSKILSECVGNSESYEDVTKSDTAIDLCTFQENFMKKSDLLRGDDKVSNKLPHIVMFPKFHKPKLSQRFVVSYANCAIKNLARNVTFGLKEVYKQICSYSNMLLKVTGINRNWVIDNNALLLDCFNSTSKGRNIETYDFTTLYTNLRHEEIKTALQSVIKLAFRHKKFNYISIYKSSGSFVNSVRKGGIYFDVEKLIDACSFLIDNSYFSFGSYTFRQKIGVPIGVDPGPFIANLTLWYFENKYLDKLYRVDYYSARLLNKTYRLIDDITTINSDGVFANHYMNIYPESLQLNKENSGCVSANVLDLDIVISEGNFKVNVYDKRDNFPFEVVQFAPVISNVSQNILYGVFGSQIIRISRICNDGEYFLNRTEKLIRSFGNLGYSLHRLKSVFKKCSERQKFVDKFGDEVGLKCMNLFKNSF